MTIFLLGVMTAAHAVQPDEILGDPKLEARARDIGQELRCLVCQNQSIDDSDAPLAHDLRVLLRRRLTAGDTDEAARQYIVARYGDYVLLKPPLKTSTALLWFGPLLMLLAAAACARGFYRGRTRLPLLPLTAQERERLAKLDTESGDNS